MSYQDFLARKQRTAPCVGLSRIPKLNEQLFPFQAALVRWALRKGKAALFCATGLGKTAMQLEWARVVAEHTGGRVLILAPLAVAKQTQAQGRELLGLDATVCRHPEDAGDLPGRLRRHPFLM